VGTSGHATAEGAGRHELWAAEQWKNHAACGSIDPDQLFVRGAAQRAATVICRHCPVQLQCLADALDRQVPFGVWGGLTERERRAVLRSRPDVRSWRAHLEAMQARRQAPAPPARTR